MADIDEQLQIIKNAPRGEDVRAAIIESLRLIAREKEYPPTTLKANKNATFTGGPWNKVVVEVSGSSNLNIDNLGGDITENGYYTIQTLKDIGLLPNPNCEGIDGFVVDVPQSTGEMCEKTITENGVYDPLLDGFDGYSKVYVNVLSTGYKDSYTVKFYDGNSLKQTLNVPHGTNAVYSGGALSGANFTGWNPNPVSVTRDMNCYAVYAGSGPQALVNVHTETIKDTWAQICQKVGNGTRPYQPGSTKLLILTGPGGAQYMLNMCLIGYNMDKDSNNKYVSTWINICNDNNIRSIHPSSAAASYNVFGNSTLSTMSVQNLVTNYGHTVCWESSLWRALWNANPNNILTPDDLTYYNKMKTANSLLPDLINTAAGTNLWGAIKEVTKYSYWHDASYADNVITWLPKNDYVTKDKIWLPSTRELAYPVVNSSLQPVAFPAYMCTSGTTTQQYGNPNMFGTITQMLGIVVETANRYITRDNFNFNASQGNCFVGEQTINNAQTPYITYAANYINTNASNMWLPIGFCI